MFGRPAAIVTVLTLANSLSVTGFTFLAPLLVDLAREFGTTVAVTGQLAVATAIPWSLGGLLMGPLSDRYGRRPVVVAGAFVMGLATASAALAGDLPTLVALRFLTGCAGAAMSPILLAGVGDLFQGSARTRAFGWVNAGFAFAALLGVPLATVIAGGTNWRVAFAVVGCATMALVLPLSRLSFPPARHSPKDLRADYAGLFRRRAVWLVLGSNGLERALYAAAATYFPPLLIQRYELPLRQVAPVLAVTAVGGLIGNLAGARVEVRVPAAKLFATCQAGAAALVLLVFASAPPLALAAALVFAFGAINAYSRPTLLTLVTDLGTKARGSMLGVLATSNQGGFTLGAAAGGLALALADYPGMGAVAGILGVSASLFAVALSRSLARG